MEKEGERGQRRAEREEQKGTVTTYKRLDIHLNGHEIASNQHGRINATTQITTVTDVTGMADVKDVTEVTDVTDVTAVTDVTGVTDVTVTCSQKTRQSTCGRFRTVTKHAVTCRYIPNQLIDVMISLSLSPAHTLPLSLNI
jgi:hypothetical protein